MAATNPTPDAASETIPGPCVKCNGTGRYTGKHAHAKSICFACKGFGRKPMTRAEAFAAYATVRANLIDEIEVLVHTLVLCESADKLPEHVSYAAFVAMCLRVPSDVRRRAIRAVEHQHGPVAGIRLQRAIEQMEKKA